MNFFRNNYKASAFNCLKNKFNFLPKGGGIYNKILSFCLKLICRHYKFYVLGINQTQSQ